jgi:hypothetical protein
MKQRACQEKNGQNGLVDLRFVVMHGSRPRKLGMKYCAVRAGGQSSDKIDWFGLRGCETGTGSAGQAMRSAAPVKRVYKARRSIFTSRLQELARKCRRVTVTND